MRGKNHGSTSISQFFCASLSNSVGIHQDEPTVHKAGDIQQGEYGVKNTGIELNIHDQDATSNARHHMVT